MRQRQDEHGSVSIWAVLIVTTIALTTGISVDLTGQIAAKLRATDVAAQAARIAGEQADANTVMGGQPHTRVDTDRARQAALDYIASADMTGRVTITAAGDEVQVTTTALYRPVFLGSFGLGPFTVTGNSSARLVRAQNGTER